MKFSYCFLIVFFAVNHLAGQEWSPIGAEWYYDITYASNNNIDFHRVYCDSVVKIKNRDCKRINIDFSACNIQFGGKLYTYKSQDTIFFYNQAFNEFEVLYNFNAKKSDSWKIKRKDNFSGSIDTVTVIVDSISAKVVNSKTLKVLVVRYKYNQIYSFSSISQIIESIGDLNFIINILPKYYPTCDFEFLRNLRCYNDPILGTYSTGLRDSCNYIFKASLSSIYLNQTKIYPNPTSDKLFIESDARIKKISIVDLLGIQHFVENPKAKQTVINTGSMPSGLYFIHIEDERENVTVHKLEIAH